MIISVPELEYETTEFSREKGEYWYSDEQGWSKTQPEIYEAPKEEEVSVDNVTLANTGNIVVHYPMAEMDKAKIYYWNVLPNDMETEWPGDKLACDDTWYTYSFNAVNKVNFLFANGDEQTEDFTLKTAGEYWYSNGSWVTEEPGKGNSGEDKPDDPKPTAPSRPDSTPTPSKRSDFRDETIYFLMTTRFYDGDSTNNRYCWNDVGRILRTFKIKKNVEVTDNGKIII